jgi:mannose-6-phosphate isomerase-like protein (cupin superfamily)
MSVISGPQRPTHELGDTRFTSLATPSRGSSDTAGWMVEMDPGAQATPHELTREEIFVVLDGRASIMIGGRAISAERNDAIVVPPATTFELANAGDRSLRMLCCMPAGGQARLADGTLLTPPWSL